MGGLFGVITSDSNSKEDNNSSSIVNSKATNISLDFAQLRLSQNYLFYGGGFAGRISVDTEVTNCMFSGIINAKSRSNSATIYLDDFACSIESSKFELASEVFVSISYVRGSNTPDKLCIDSFSDSNGIDQINLDNFFCVWQY